MAGIFDFLGGGPAPTPGLLDAAGYMDPAQYDAARRSQGMMGLWAGLLQGGGPSLEPRNFGSALGAGLGGMQKFGSAFDEDQLHASQAAQARANVGKLGADAENLRASTKMLADAAAMGIGMQAPGAAGAGGTAPNFGAGGGGQRAVSSMTANTDLPPEARGFLDTVAGPESGGAYNARWPGTTFAGYDDHPRIFAAGPQGPSSAAGRYQIVATTWDGLNKKYNFSDFKPETQDTAAWKLAEDTYRSRTGQDLLTALKEGKLQDVQQMLKGQWPTLNLASYGTNLRKYTGGAGAGTATAEAGPVPGGAIPEFAGGRAGALGGPVPAAVAGGPAAPVPGPLAGAPSGNRPGTNLPATGPGLITPQDYEQWLARQRGAPGGSGGGGPPRPFDGTLPRTAAEAGGGGDDMAGPSLAPGGVFSPAAQAIAAGAAAVPATAVAPAPAIPPAPSPPVAPAPAPPALAPAAAAAALPAPPVPAAALPLPARPELPARQPLPAQPALPAAPAPPPMPGAVAVPPLPAAQAPPAAGAQPYSPQAHKAQMIATALSMAGRTVPAFIAEAAGLPLAGQKAALEAAARQPFTLQGQQYGHALAMAKADWEARDARGKQEFAARLNMTEKGYDADIRRQETDYKAGLDLAQKEHEKRLELAGAGPIEQAKSGAQADNTQTTMVIGNREVPMTVGQANRISRGEPPETVLGPRVLELGKQYLTPDQQSRAQAGGTKSVEYSFKRLEDADTAGGAASRNLQTLGQLAQAAERFKTGATAEVWLDIKRYARDAGLITGADVPDGELIRQASTKMAVMNAPRQGAMSNYERGLMATINPQLVNSPEAFAQLVAIGARLDQYDMQVARIHNEVAEKKGGVPDYLEANRRIRELGSPISPAERSALERLQAVDAAKGAATAPATGVAPFRWDPAANGGQGAVVPNTGR